MASCWYLSSALFRVNSFTHYSTVTSASAEILRRSSVSTYLPPSTSIYIFTDEQIKEIDFEEPDSDDSITWIEPFDESSILRRSLRSSSSDTAIIRSATIIKLIQRMTSGYSGMYFEVQREYILIVCFRNS